MESRAINFDMNQILVNKYRKKPILVSVVDGRRMVHIYSGVWMLGPQVALLDLRDVVLVEEVCH